MTSAVARLNRVILTVVGLAMSAAAVAGLVLSLGGLGVRSSHRRILERQVTSYVAGATWFWWAVAGGCIVIGLLSLAWLLAQGSTQRIARLDLTAGGTEGTTVVHAGAVTEAIEHEVTAWLGVTSASARLRANPSYRIDVTVGLDDTADLAEVRRRLQRQTVTNVRRALDLPDLPVNIQLRPTPGGQARVR